MNGGIVAVLGQRNGPWARGLLMNDWYARLLGHRQTQTSMDLDPVDHFARRRVHGSSRETLAARIGQQVTGRTGGGRRRPTEIELDSRGGGGLGDSGGLGGRKDHADTEAPVRGRD